MFSNVFWLMIAIFVTLTINNANSANILCLMGTPSPSHHIWNKSIMRALADRGNNLTILTVEMERSTKNMHFIHMENVYDAIYENFTSDENNDLTNKNVYKTITQLYRFSSFVGRQIIGTEGAKQLLHYPVDFKFDAVIHDFTQSQVLLGFVYRFGYPPLISVSPSGIPPFTYAVAQLPIFPSYSPHKIGTFTNQMGFYERIRNWSYFFYDWVYRRYVYMTNENRKARKLFGEFLPKLETIESVTELVLVNVDFSIDYPQVLPPNVIPVGGLQVKRKEKRDELVESFLKESTRGAVYFSLGSTLQVSDLGDQIHVFIEAIRRLTEYNFIWKFDIKAHDDLPSNLLTGEWFSQNNILCMDFIRIFFYKMKLTAVIKAHPNTKLFITHGGLLSVQESIWHGVLMLGIPFYLDQHQNMAKVAKYGVGEYLNLNNITIDLLVQTIKTIIESPSYADNIKIRSKLFQNQPMHPLERAIFWIENTISNRGTKHLSLSNLNFFQIYMIDVIALFSVVGLLFVLIIRRHIHFGSDKKTSTIADNVNKTEKIE